MSTKGAHKKSTEDCVEESDMVLAEPIAAKFKNSGMRMTQSRLKIIDVLSQTEQALSPSELFAELKSKFKKENFDRVTVYRILEKFEELGVVHPVGNGKYIYCMHQACSHDKHFIVICDKCHKVQEVGGEAKPLKVLASFLEEEAGFQMTNDSIVIRGLCKKCQTK